MGWSSEQHESEPEAKAMAAMALVPRQCMRQK